MSDFKTSSVLEVLDTIANESTKLIKLMIIEECIERFDIRLTLNLMAGGLIKKPNVRFNTFTSADDFADIVGYFHTGIALGLPQNTLRLLAIIADSNMIGLTRGDLHKILQDTESLIDVYKYFGEPEEILGCKLCGDGNIVQQDLCGYCYDTLEGFTEHRSSDSFTIVLGSDNYKRFALLIRDGFIVRVENYEIVICNNVLLYKRTGIIMNAQLPFGEYQN